MIHAQLRFEDFGYLVEMLGLAEVLEERQLPASAHWRHHEGNILNLGHFAEVFLSLADDRAFELIQDREEVNPNLRYERLQRALSSFYFDRLDDIRQGLDYNAELRFRECMISEETYPNLYRYLVAIPGDRGFGLERENHNFGYHIHLVQIGKRNLRTNAIFMFNPHESETTNPILYWEPHHETANVHINPESFGARRKVAIYDTCTPFLRVVQKSDFKQPSGNASLFHPTVRGKTNNQ